MCFSIGFLKPQCSLPPPPQRGRGEACTCFSGMCALHQRRLSTGNICIFISILHSTLTPNSNSTFGSFAALPQNNSAFFCVPQLFPWNPMVLTVKSNQNTFINQCTEVIFRALNWFPLCLAITHAKYVWSCNMSVSARNKTHHAPHVYTYKYSF